MAGQWKGKNVQIFKMSALHVGAVTQCLQQIREAMHTSKRGDESLF
jgi:hypothetical protein